MILCDMLTSLIGMTVCVCLVVFSVCFFFLLSVCCFVCFVCVVVVFLGG